ncbi:protein TBATA isoform X6 [Hippopotamus amphibius kiboko]|uniref:protein TBATA isoform X6 n=1 Tax=Hippopotamus amphibius kiboko TaxID=575201 RepID=UPI00259133FA|nr:protein TBATA isoform X6 [Hippopotamus amphibius kiboko]
MATEARTQLAEQQRTRAEPKPEKKSGCGLRSHEDSRPQKELMIPGIVDLELIREARRPSKPQTPGAYRFGRLSHHSFFSRHHPHPQHVTHIQEAWKKELKDLASRVAIFTKENEMKNKESLWPLFSQQKEEPQREQGAKYSAETGRLIPASTRATARRHSRQGVRNAPASRDGGDQTFILQDQELLILELLSQVLQTDSLNAIQFWLLYAPPKEKDMALGLLQTAVAQLLPQPLASIPADKLLNQLQEIQEPLQERQQRPYSQSPKKTKTPPLSKSEKPENIGKAQVLQVHSSQNPEEKAAKPEAEG